MVMFSKSKVRSRQLLLGACMVGLSVLFAGSAGAETPVKGGTLVVARAGDIFTLDPYNTQDDPSIFTELTVFDRLVRLSADGQGIEPELAEKWSIAKDGRSADFTLREGVKFSDGRSMNIPSTSRCRTPSHPCCQRFPHSRQASIPRQILKSGANRPATIP